jgi:hypothetical protein
MKITRFLNREFAWPANGTAQLDPAPDTTSRLVNPGKIESPDALFAEQETQIVLKTSSHYPPLSTEKGRAAILRAVQLVTRIRYL